MVHLQYQATHWGRESQIFNKPEHHQRGRLLLYSFTGVNSGKCSSEVIWNKKFNKTKHKSRERRHVRRVCVCVCACVRAASLCSSLLHCYVKTLRATRWHTWLLRVSASLPGLWCACVRVVERQLFLQPGRWRFMTWDQRWPWVEDLPPPLPAPPLPPPRYPGSAPWTATGLLQPPPPVGPSNTEWDRETSDALWIYEICQFGRLFYFFSSLFNSKRRLWMWQHGVFCEAQCSHDINR